MAGVAFFSYIMGEFIEIIQRYNAKISMPDKSEHLALWKLGLQRFTSGTPLSKSVADQIDTDFSYYWTFDRTVCFPEDNEDFSLLPISVKQEIMVEYLFWDIITTNQFFSNKTVRIDQEYLYEVCRGLQPRRFDAEDEHDKKIYLEDMEVHELYIIM